MIVVDCEQGDETWKAIRTGLITATDFAKIYTQTGKVSSSIEVLMYELVAERISGKTSDDYSNYWMGRGVEMEQQARDAYQFITDNEVQQIGFAYLDERKHVGCSPDGLIGDDGGFEAKCPKASTHVKYLLAKKVPSEYYPQVQGNMWITGRKYWDFTSYHPDFEPLIIRVERNEDYIKGLAEEVDKLSKKVDQYVKQLRGLI